jgi:hypothetical protein
MRRALLLALAATPAFAHMMSMSTGDLTVEGARARYELRMPMFELTHVKDAGPGLLTHIRFRSSGAEPSLASSACRVDDASATYLCRAEYDFPSPPDRIDVECDYYRVTVPNHVHLLRAERGGARDQALFDASFSHALLRFTPPSAWETAATQAGAGFIRALGGAAQALFLAALALAARSRRELTALAAAFLAGQALAVAIVPHTGWSPAPRFVEAAAALAVAYLAIEILLLPKAGSRWVVAGVLGGFHGLYFDLFLRESGFRAPLVLAGAAVADVLAVVVFAFVLRRVARIAQVLRPIQVSAAGLFVFGMAWFYLRLNG